MAPGIDGALQGKRVPFTDAHVAWADRTEAAIDFRGDVERVKATCSLISSDRVEAIVVMQKFVRKRVAVPSARELLGRLGFEFFGFDRAIAEAAVDKCIGMTRAGFNKPEGDLARVGTVSCKVRALEDDGEGRGRGFDISLCVGACDVTTGFTSF